jgi:hypothetical protein
MDKWHLTNEFLENKLGLQGERALLFACWASGILHKITEEIDSLEHIPDEYFDRRVKKIITNAVIGSRDVEMPDPAIFELKELPPGRITYWMPF